MEDGVTMEGDDQNLTRTHEDNHDEGKGHQGGGGFVSQVLSSLVPKGKNGGEEKEEELGEGERDQYQVIKEEEKNEEKPSSTGGGILDHLISTLVSPLSPRASTNRDKGEIFHESSCSSSTDRHQGGEVEDGGEREEEAAGSEEGSGVTGEGSSSSSIIDNIVSHLPILPDDSSAPTTDEASILLHSIVRD